MSEVKQIDIKIYTGEDFSMTFIARDPETSIARDLRGATVTAQLRKYPAGTNPFDFEITNYGASGRVRMRMLHETTARIGYAYGSYEVKAVYANNTTETLLWGRVFILPAVTKVVTGTAETILAFNSFDEFPEVGTAYRLYLDITAGLLYRWNGTIYENTLKGLSGGKGNDGVGIADIRKIQTSGNVDTYEIEYTDGSTSTYDITNGASIVDIYLAGSEGMTDTYTVVFDNGNTSSFSVQNGSNIESITWADTDGIIDTYMITLTDGSNTTFQVRNGLDGIGAPVHVEGEMAVVTALLPDQLSLTEVIDGVAYIGALLPDTGWQTLTDASFTGTINYRKISHQVVITASEITLNTALSTDSVVLGTVPAIYLPDLTEAWGMAGNKTHQGIITVDPTTGNITFTKTDGVSTWGTTDKISFNLSYFSAPGASISEP